MKPYWLFKQLSLLPESTRKELHAWLDSDPNAIHELIEAVAKTEPEYQYTEQDHAIKVRQMMDDGM